MDKYMLEERIKKTEYLVEADSFASQCLWERHASDAVDKFGDWPRYSWENQNPGLSLEVGQLGGFPVMVTLFWHVVGGALLCFFSSDSRVTDHQMVSNFLAEHFPGVPVCDAMNFHYALERVRGLDVPPVVLEENDRLLGREAVERFREDGVITTHAFEVASLAADRGEDGAAEILLAVQQIQDACERFRERVWLPWLKTYYRGSPDRGHVARSADLVMMVYGLAGRVMATLRPRADSCFHVSLLGYDGEENGMYVRGGCGTAAALVEMIDGAASAADMLSTDIHPDDSVQLAI